MPEKHAGEVLLPPWVPLKDVRRGMPLLVRGEGVYLWDQRGHRVLDARSGSACVSVGYGRAEIAERVSRQLLELSYAHVDWKAHPAAVELARRLLAAAPPGLERVYLASGGSEALDTAVKIVRQYMRSKGWKDRNVVLYRKDSYHGATLGATSLTGIESLREPFEPLLGGTREVCTVDCRQCPLGRSYPSCEIACVDEIEKAILEAGPSKVAALVAEPVNAWGRVRVPPPEYWPRLRRVLEKHGILLILDEVTTGMGRTGDWFAASRFAVRPDLLLVGKGLSSGYAPIGAVLLTGEVASAFEDAPFMHSYTFGGHPASCAASLAAFDLLEGLVGRVPELGRDLQASLARAAEPHLFAGPVEGVGLLASVGLSFPAGRARELSGALRGRLYAGGLLCQVTEHSLQVAPPLCIEPDHIRDICGAVADGLNWLETQAPRARGPAAEAAAAGPEDLSGVQELSFLPRPFDLSGESTELFIRACREMSRFHMERSPELRHIYQEKGFSPGSLERERDLASLPFIGVPALKRFQVCSISPDTVYSERTSSGTGGERAKVYWDMASASRRRRVYRAAAEQLGLRDPRPVRYLVFAHEPRGAGEDINVALNFRDLQQFAPAAETFHAVDWSAGSGWRLRREEAAARLELWSRGDVPIRLLGLPAFIHETLSGLTPLRLPEGSLMVTAGGWKAFEDRRVTREEFRSLAVQALGLPEASVRDGYGMAEHGIFYLECSRHRFHVPACSRVIPRDPATLEPVETGSDGLLELIAPINAAMPTLAILSMDLGSLESAPCPCGLGTPTFRLAGRAGVERLRGCALRLEELVSSEAEER